ncbi:hypothetical protein KFL_001290210 [Klebsormidium nitens]|uniref:NADH dehydrogenase [ubiquinone] 1 beta subcomplex subunit 2 n=1 Tax=Klebsormidium nitens TaxID=105231 RepID=A0A1Y1HWA9_KLENI|nr:hypothetical protein KFL_001290210 [Klebsormidium nitens]|eukprot:GAQ82930.1 hypothetical protein KFL_001290210 [Klebsormidium nitens]
MAGGHGPGITYAGLTLYPPKRWQVRTGQGMCALMWFWILYRAKEDGAVFLGLRHPWDHHAHGHSANHDDGHSHTDKVPSKADQ